jgi:hypothetical protein
MSGRTASSHYSIFLPAMSGGNAISALAAKVVFFCGLIRQAPRASMSDRHNRYD